MKAHITLLVAAIAVGASVADQKIRETLDRNTYGVDADEVMRDLFTTMSPPLKGYRRMAWIVGSLDDGHWDRVPEQAREWNIAQRFRKENPGVPIRVLLIEKPITHYAHIERPKELAAVLVGAVKWVVAN